MPWSPLLGIDIDPDASSIGIPESQSGSEAFYPFISTEDTKTPFC
jgi:hypothetical protein